MLRPGRGTAVAPDSNSTVPLPPRGRVRTVGHTTNVRHSPVLPRSASVLPLTRMRYPERPAVMNDGQQTTSSRRVFSWERKGGLDCRAGGAHAWEVSPDEHL